MKKFDLFDLIIPGYIVLLFLGLPLILTMGGYGSYLKNVVYIGAFIIAVCAFNFYLLNLMDKKNQP
jgi:hypothetical protein